MNCPFCKTALNIPEASLASEELHYDCPVCNSSLFFEKGECQILSEGSLPDSSTTQAEDEIKESSQISQQDSSPEEEQALQTQNQALIEEEEEQVQENPLATEETLENETSKIQESYEEKPSETSQEKEEKNTAKGVPFVDEESLSSDEMEHLKDEEKNIQQKTSSDEAPEAYKKPEDFSDVEKFGNISGNTHQGPFYYTLLIEEINSKEVRQHLENVLSDEGLNLSSPQIKDGTLRLPRLTPAATHVIVKALLGWSVKISWEQELVVDHVEEESES